MICRPQSPRSFTARSRDENNKATWTRDRRIQIGKEIEGENRQLANGTAREQIGHPKQTAGLATKNPLPDGRIDARQRNKGPDSVDKERTQRQRDAPHQVRILYHAQLLPHPLFSLKAPGSDWHLHRYLYDL